MQVEVLPAAPLPGGVKVARRSVKPFVLVRVQVWQPISGCNVSSSRAFARGHHLGRRKTQVSRACGTTLTISGRQADKSWLTCLENRIGPNRGRSITDAFRHFGHVPTLNRNPQRKEILCDLLSVTKANCSIARATNQIELSESDRRS